MGEKKIVIDTNNLIAALGWDGKSRVLMRKVIAKEYEWYISRKQLDELIRVMDYPKFRFTKEQKENFLEIILSVAKIIDTKLELFVVEDKDDNIILETAIESGAEYVISGDKHLKKIMNYSFVKILSVNEFLKLNS